MSRSVEILLSARDQASASIKKVTDALKAENLAVAEAKRLFEATLTPQEKFVRGQRQLHMAMMSGKLGLLEYTRALEQLNRGMERAAQSQRAYMARVRYNSNMMAAQSAQAAAVASSEQFQSERAYMGRVRYNSNLMAAQAAQSAAEAAAQSEQSQRGYLARVRYNSSVMAAQTAQASAAAAASRRAQIQGVAGALNFTDPTFNPFYFDPNQGQGMLARARGRMGRFFGGAGAMLGGALPAIGVAAGASYSFDQFAQKELSEARLAAVLRATGRTDISLGGIRDYAARRSRQTMFGGDDIVSAAATLAPFQHIKGETFHKTLKAAQDLATVMGTDVTSAAYKLGKAMENPQTLLASLHQGGVVFEESLKKQIKALAEAGDYQQAHAMILDEVARRAGGAAEVAGKTAAGQWKQLKEELSDVAALLGSHLVPAVKWLRGQLQNLTPPEQGAPARAGQDQLNAADPLDRAALARKLAMEARRKEKAAFDESLNYGFLSNWHQTLTGAWLWGGGEAKRQNLQSEGWNQRAAAMQFESQAKGYEKAAQTEAMRRLGNLPSAAATRFRNVSDALGDLFTGRDAHIVETSSGAKFQKPGVNILGGLAAEFSSIASAFKPRSARADDKAFQRLIERYRRPAEVRDAQLKELNRFKHLMTSDQYDFARKQIDEDFDRKARGARQGGRTSQNTAVESGYLTRGPGMLDPMLVEAKNAAKQRKVQIDKADAIIAALGVIGGAIGLTPADLNRK